MTSEWDFANLDELEDEFGSMSSGDLAYHFHSQYPDYRGQDSLSLSPPSDATALFFDTTPPRSNRTAHMPRRTNRVASAPEEVVDLTEDTPIAMGPQSSRHQHTIVSEAPQGQKRKRDEELEVKRAESVEEGPTPPAARAERREGHTKIGQMTCIICMEAFVNASTGQCGHIFCHECLTRALMASERHQDRGAGSCPTCRKPIYRKKANQVIPINFMKKSTYKKKT